jgi:2-polyprenyl-6-hydroxyphenyl methylase/3-demethylubiquinone-9 3-methyltransferase
LKPGGRIIVTTPNYYALRGRLWAPLRFMSRRGGGLRVQDILELHTLAHHWKEFSLKELIEYFRILSPDFLCATAREVEESNPRNSPSAKYRVAIALERLMPSLRPSLHLEIELRTKEHGIVVTPHW